MAELDDKGYAAERPLKPEQWADFFKGAPPGCIISSNTIPPGMLVVQNYLTATFCDTLVKECEEVEGKRHSLGRKKEDGSIESVVDDTRTSEAVPLSKVNSDVTSVVRQAFQFVAAQHFRVQLDWFEQPEILRYREGGKYTVHSDAHNWLRDKKTWSRVLDRDISILLYINNDFEGGQLIFPNCEFTLTPSRGLLVAFPSDWRYLHGAQPVTKGTRYAIVSWAAARGGPRINPTPPNTAIRV